MDRVNNVEKSRRKRKAEVDIGDSETPNRKRGRPKRIITLESRYPKLASPPDDSGDQQKEQALALELEKGKPRKDVVLQLMKGTFFTRRQYILHDNGSVVSKLTKYPGLKMPLVVSIVQIQKGINVGLCMCAHTNPTLLYWVVCVCPY